MSTLDVMTASDVDEIVEQALLAAEPDWVACPVDDKENRRSYAVPQMRSFRDEQLQPPLRETVSMDDPIATSMGVSPGERVVWFTNVDSMDLFNA